MYLRSTPGAKHDSVKRWNLPDRVFFACGACHILAHALLERYGRPGMTVLWFKPAPGSTGNHIVVATEAWVFDYYGYCVRNLCIARTFDRARLRMPGWGAALVPLPPEVPISERRFGRIGGLWLREPRQFVHDALPRARRYLGRFGPPPDR
ncbi:hypothetical protein MMSR116_30615 [Methylobacterium mesophilicum SR1.6/6]|uniref:Uncharacterized protein n=1 Tax=Methylobacterium mesophilicum SR1.6/6 TaxID=908290 RepID=A0A6B9FTL7_9HYPH|nr:hypothetical protein [Methylobacterium mesophilicum]QGY05767.1 hypothetical protein MMSR116_30615 [Methylobacterium mesophilicum SR1.6/6]